nr:immunoglobulin heavy chain junction region [Macaca mulatta]MOV51657.1 immunoglobulin heavy chain junction region [Macaca mulatta]MOV52585.1 immunoglobulin heavy chain junction region [Macaca mulatta]MOV52864.1 immunoglobulin heavy chain junction region [Macaca mulatta]
CAKGLEYCSDTYCFSVYGSGYFTEGFDCW